jgi:hypothetical protein
MASDRPNIQAIAARAQALAGGAADAAANWVVVEEADYRKDGTPVAWREVRVGREVIARLDFGRRVEAEFIASARADVPALLAEVARLERVVAEQAAALCAGCAMATRVAERLGWGGSTDSFTTSDGDPVAWMSQEIRALRAAMKVGS